MITFQPKQHPSIIKVLGVGGGGSNAVNHMFKQGITGVDFAVCNTDVQALESSPVPIKIEIGNKGGLGAGADPEVGKAAAEDSIEKLKELLGEDSTQMLFITAGMGGGTGTGAAPIIAKLAREMEVLTVGIVTLPFGFEGRKRKQQAELGINEIKKYVDALLVISNDKLREQFGNLVLGEAFAQADNVLANAAKGIAELITVTGYVNVDFEDVRTVIKDSGKAIMGSAQAEGQDRAGKAIEEAMNSPLLNDNEIAGATNILLYITTGEEDITMDEITEITDYVQKESGNEAETIWGVGKDESLENNIGITIIATGFDAAKKENEKPKAVVGTVGDGDQSNKSTIPAKSSIPSDNETDLRPDITEIERINIEPKTSAIPKDDESKKDSVNTHNSADQLIYQTESQIKEAGEKLTDDEKKPIEGALEQLKQANSGSDLESIKTAIESLNKAWEPVAQKMYQAAQSEAQSNGADVNSENDASASASTKKEEVEDADFEVVEDEK